MDPIVWDHISRVYDWQLPLERRPVTALLDLAKPRPEDRLLDVGTGTGGVLRELARRRSRPSVAVGVDSSLGMLARVPSLPPGWSLQPGDAMALPFPSRQFDVVTAAYLLHLLDSSSLERMLAEIRRVLIPGGRLATVTPAAPRSWLRRPYELLVAALIRVTGTSIGLRPFDPGADLARVGFTPVSACYVHRGYPSLCVLSMARP